MNKAAEAAGFDLAWEGEGESAVATDRTSNKVIVKINPEYYRPAEVDFLLGDPVKARDVLGWSPSVKFERLVEMMVRADLDRAAEKRLP